MRHPDPFAFWFSLWTAVLLTATTYVLWLTERRKQVTPREYGWVFWQGFWAMVCWVSVWRYS